MLNVKSGPTRHEDVPSVLVQKSASRGQFLEKTAGCLSKESRKSRRVRP
jgi:hypothetical protein